MHHMTPLAATAACTSQGEEENGSIGFHEAVSSNLRWFEGTELIVISNTNWIGENLPCVTYGMVRVGVGSPRNDL